MRDGARDDSELVALANRGNAAGLEGLFRAHGEWVAALAQPVPVPHGVKYDTTVGEK